MCVRERETEGETHTERQRQKEKEENENITYVLVLATEKGIGYPQAGIVRCPVCVLGTSLRFSARSVNTLNH